MSTVELVRSALAQVNDPELHRPITELGMVDSLTLAGSEISVTILLTISGCPMQIAFAPMSQLRRSQLRESRM